jgi:hypothetical protein
VFKIENRRTTEFPMVKKAPVLAANHSPKGKGSAPEPEDEKERDAPRNLPEQDRQGNIRQSTRNQG